WERESGWCEEPGPEEDEAGDPDEEERLRNIYRELARMLHPDLRPGPGERTETDRDRLELWYEVQHAYGQRNLAVLETLKTLVRIRLGGGIDGERVSDLKDAVRYYEDSFGPVER